MSRRLRLLGVSAIVAGVAGAAIPATASAVPVITMSGSTSVAPLASLLAKGYLKQYPKRVKFTADLMAKVGNIEKGKTPTYDQIVDKTFAEKAIKDLGPWKGPICPTAVF